MKVMNQAPYIIKDYFRKIPFIEIIIPYTENFASKVDLVLSPLLKDKLEYNLLEQLSYIAEVTLNTELDKFVANGSTSFDEFVEIMAFSLATDYPVLDEKLKMKSSDFSKHVHSIVTRFQKDIKNIESTFNLKNTKIVNIDVCLGDRHNGEGTSSVCLSDGSKLIYKPRDISVTHSYNSFISWVSCRLKTDLKTFKVLDCGDYGWIEFVHYEAVSSKEDLEEYYYKAGILLAVALLLGSKDCHHENLIASGKNPVIIDHETIIQPFFNDKSFHSWEDQFKIPSFSVLESVLIVNRDTGAPLDIVGYGMIGHVEITALERKVLNPNTINSKITTCFVTKKTVDKNVPKFEDKYHFVNEYKEHFINGFSVAYDMFMDFKKELTSENSPLKLFIHNEVRYVWRPTFVYSKVLKYMRSATFMSSYDVYYSKLYELLSKAFKGENRGDYKFILDFEISQMLNGDIPIFNLQSIDNFLEGNESLKVFQYNCLENIFHRIDLLSSAHKNEQLSYINKWLES